MKHVVHILEDPFTRPKTFCGLDRVPYFSYPQTVFIPSGTGTEIPFCKNCKRTRAFTVLVLAQR